MRSVPQEAIEERRVTVGDVSRSAPAPSSAIATQNPSNQEGTFPLRESQSDRFL